MPPDNARLDVDPRKIMQYHFYRTICMRESDCLRVEAESPQEAARKMNALIENCEVDALNWEDASRVPTSAHIDYTFHDARGKTYDFSLIEPEPDRLRADAQRAQRVPGVTGKPVFIVRLTLGNVGRGHTRVFSSRRAALLQMVSAMEKLMDRFNLDERGIARRTPSLDAILRDPERWAPDDLSTEWFAHTNGWCDISLEEYIIDAGDG